MDSQLFTLSKIFTERILRIPDYQRGYAWGTQQLTDFWNDLQQIEPSGNHYTGVLTLETVPPENALRWTDDLWIIQSKSYQPFYVVDGQQRLTTAIILIEAIIEGVDSSIKLNYSTIEEIRKKYIFDSKDEGISKSYIFGYDKDNPSYEFLKTRIFGEFSSTSNPVEETAYTNNLETAKSFFSAKIDELDLESIEGLFKKVTQQLLFNIFTISEEVDVCVAFETMNNRGKPLSYLELLKNRLIYLSLKVDESDHEKHRLRSAINDCWKEVYHSLGRNKYVSSLQLSVRSWYRMFSMENRSSSNSVDVWLDKLDRIGGGRYHDVLVLAILLKVTSDDEKVRLLKALEREVFVRDFIFPRYSGPGIDYANLAMLLFHDKITASQASLRISEGSKRYAESEPVMNDAILHFKSNGFYSWQLIRYFMYEYDLSLKLRSKTERAKLIWEQLIERQSDYRTIEHIYPQNAKTGYWTERFSGLIQKQRGSLKNSLGNLLPLSQPKNSSLSNSSFPEKLSGKNENPSGFRYGCYAENEVAKETEWTPIHIRDRGLKLLDFLEKRWSISLGDRDRRLAMLGLEFLR